VTSDGSQFHNRNVLSILVDDRHFERIATTETPHSDCEEIRILEAIVLGSLSLFPEAATIQMQQICVIAPHDLVLSNAHSAINASSRNAHVIDVIGFQKPEAADVHLTGSDTGYHGF
jgi:hypothetical protein